MEDVEGMMGKMSEVEKKGVRIGRRSRSKEMEGPKEVQAMVKVLSEKFVLVAAIEQSLGGCGAQLRASDAKMLVRTTSW
jgi:hypothetical protein